MLELSVIIPTYNEESIIEDTLETLARLVNIDEVVIVDGGSTDKTVRIIEKFDDPLQKITLVKTKETIRAKQFSEGVARAKGEVLWFLLPEMRPKQGTARKIKAVMKYKEIVGGEFELIFEARKSWSRLLAKLLQWVSPSSLSCLNSSIFVRRKAYENAGGFEYIPFLELHELRRKLSKQGNFVILADSPISLSFEKIERQSAVRFLSKFVTCQVLHFLGLPPKIISKVLSLMYN
ncbi:MAG: glycosyltransferase [Pyrinomonadaceae bacterium]|nr:glycosyltransferase [Pyrinomonadaceae bacterium]MCX7639647.1 glycosyltransferase [Pyrinomonadaceae bacterium]MDW8303335.1 glycosyltransferase [Acidobacteriota bacterium]